MHLSAYKNTLCPYCRIPLGEFDPVVVCPQCPEGYVWDNLIFQLDQIVADAINDYPVDSSRVSLTGLSMGGFGAWSYAITRPRRFFRLAPICGGGMYWNAVRLAGVPVWAFHGGQDKLVLPEESQKMVDAVNTRGGNAKLTIYPNNKHDAWTDTYSNPEVYEWLLSHRNSNFVGDDHYDDAEKYG